MYLSVAPLSSIFTRIPLRTKRKKPTLTAKLVSFPVNKDFFFLIAVGLSLEKNTAQYMQFLAELTPFIFMPRKKPEDWGELNLYLHLIMYMGFFVF